MREGDRGLPKLYTIVIGKEDTSTFPYIRVCIVFSQINIPI